MIGETRIPATIVGLGYPVVNLLDLLEWLYDNRDEQVRDLIEPLETGLSDKESLELTNRIMDNLSDSI